MADSVCIHHTSRKATARCYTCHKPICAECVVQPGDGTFCSKTCAEKYAKFHASYQSERRSGLFALLKTLVVTAIVLAVLAALTIFAGAKFLKLDFCAELLRRWGL